MSIDLSKIRPDFREAYLATFPRADGSAIVDATFGVGENQKVLTIRFVSPEAIEAILAIANRGGEFPGSIKHGCEAVFLDLAAEHGEVVS